MKFGIILKQLIHIVVEACVMLNYSLNYRFTIALTSNGVKIIVKLMLVPRFYMSVTLHLQLYQRLAMVINAQFHLKKFI